MHENHQSNTILKVATSIWVIFTLLFIYIVTKPQCPSGFTQAEIDNSTCVVGANIGAGIMLPIAGAATFVIVVMWVIFLFSKISSR